MRAVPYTGAAVFIICGIVRESISEVEWMTLKEAEELFKDLNGEDPYIIWHEAGEKTLHEYFDLKIPVEEKKRWTEELMQRHFDDLASSPDYACSAFAKILDLLEYDYCDAKRYGSMLLDMMELMNYLDEEDRIYIIELMGSRLRNKPSGCRLFCERTTEGGRMNVIMENLMRFTCAPEPSSRVSKEERKRKAVEKYREEYKKWY